MSDSIEESFTLPMTVESPVATVVVRLEVQAGHCLEGQQILGLANILEIVTKGYLKGLGL